MQLSIATKLFSVAALALVQLSAAAECDASQMEELMTASELVYVSTDCATISSDFAAATKEDVCDSACMDYLSSILSEFPDCEYMGANLYSTVEFLLSECNMEGDDNAAGSLATDASLVCLSGVAVAALALANH